MSTWSTRRRSGETFTCGASCLISVGDLSGGGVGLVFVGEGGGGL